MSAWATIQFFAPDELEVGGRVDADFFFLTVKDGERARVCFAGDVDSVARLVERLAEAVRCARLAIDEVGEVEGEVEHARRWAGQEATRP